MQLKVGCLNFEAEWKIVLLLFSLPRNVFFPWHRQERSGLTFHFPPLCPGHLNSVWCDFSPFPLYLPLEVEKLSLLLALLSILRQLHLTVAFCISLSTHLLFLEQLARWGELNSVKRKWTLISFIQSNVFLKKKSEQSENKMLYNDALTPFDNEAFSSHNVEWRSESLPGLLLCVHLAQVCSGT